ncbi:MAG: palmitoyltransferase swf1 [Candelina mexicana]|nr:MAG: palmitoyltransferase swf1 [Candelina mexicana]
MLFFTGVLLSYGAYLAYIILSSLLQRTIPSTAPGQHWSIGKSWNAYFQFWAWAIVYYVRIGFVGLLALMCSPLAWGLLGYHLYLIWAGMTTNESVKWSDLREDIDDGLVLIRRKMGNSSAVPADHIITSTTTRPEYYPREWEDEDEEQDCLPDEDIEPKVAWPVSTSQVVVRTYNGGSPPPLSRLQREQGWRRVNGLQEIENIYDLGFWDNFLGIFEGG